MSETRQINTEIIPVIHMITQYQVMVNVETCIACGVKKVFLINHQVSVEDLMVCAKAVKTKYPNLWVGVNMLGVPVRSAVNFVLDHIDAIWCDETISSEDAKSMRRFNGMFFGGLAFKYQPQPIDLKLACEDSALATDVATTSGSSTGQAADVEKIKTIRGHLGNHPMAIASGVSVKNVHNYNGVADYLLVASSITNLGEMIVKDRLQD